MSIASTKSAASAPTQAGIVSLMVTMVLMIVITLIVLGFAQVSRREQRESLDRQLSSQAFFAAESGVNDAVSAIHTAIKTNAPVLEKTACKTQTNPTDPYPFDSTLSSANNVSYPCLLVTTKLYDIKGDLGADGKAVSMPIHPVGAPITTLHIKWQTPPSATPISVSDCAASVPSSNSFPKNTSTDWKCPYSVLRVDLVSTDTLSRGALTNSQTTFFLYPTKSGSANTAYSPSINGAVLPMRCTPTDCQANLTGLQATGATNYSLRLGAIYANGGSFTISADGAAGPLLLKDAQAQIDATGKAQDVLRRIQVRMSLIQNQGVSRSDYAIQSASSLCKRFGASSTHFVIPPDMLSTQDQNNPLCAPIVIRPCVLLPNDIAMVLDTSDSMLKDWGTFGLTREEELIEITNAFTDNVGITQNGNHEAIVQFDVKTSTPQYLTDNLGDIHTAIDNLNSVPHGKGTFISGGLIEADKQFTSQYARQNTSQIVILISDGDPRPTSDGPLAIDEATILKDRGVTIYTIGINNDVKPGGVLSKIATPGDFILATEPDQLAAALQGIADILTCRN